jgi:hypothetical protein
MHRTPDYPDWLNQALAVGRSDAAFGVSLGVLAGLLLTLLQLHLLG